MHKSILIIALLLLLSPVILAEEISINSIEQIINRKYSYSYIIGGGELQFFKNNTYKISYGSEGWYWNDEGTYQTKNGKVYLYPTKCTPDQKDDQGHYKFTMGDAICSLFASHNSLDYMLGIKCVSTYNKKHLWGDNLGDDKMIFDDNTAKVPEGSKRKIKDIPVITMDMKKGATISNVKIRERPSVNSKSLQYQKGLYADDAKTFPYVPSDTDVIIIARTVNREKVENWNNYWYYVNVGTYVGVENGVWLFGEFVKIK